MPRLSDHDERTSARHDPSGVELSLVLPAELIAPTLARAGLRNWLAGHDWPADEGDDLVLAVSEAVSNSVEHGYRLDHPAADVAPVELRGVVCTGTEGTRYAELTVRDHGSWLRPSVVRGNRRHGIPLMDACTDALTVDGTGAGTTVVLRSRAVPVPTDTT